MTTHKELTTGPHADAVRETWVAFRKHCLDILVVEGKREPVVLCERCSKVLWRVLKDPGAIDRHSEYPHFCEAGAALWGDWDVAVSRFCDHLGRARHAVAGIAQ